MKKLNYEKPSTKVVKLQQQAQLLAGSSELNASRGDYGEAVDDTWN